MAKGLDSGRRGCAFQQSFEQAGVKAADHRCSAAYLGKHAVAAVDRSAWTDFVLAAHLDNGLEGGGDRPSLGAREGHAESATRLPDCIGAAVTQALEFLGQRLGKDVVSAHRVTDLDRTGGEPVDLGRLAWEPTPALGIEISERNQALQVLERNRAVDVGFASHLLDTSRFAVGIEPEEDVATGEISERPKGALHVCSHSAQHTGTIGMSGLRRYLVDLSLIH